MTQESAYDQWQRVLERNFFGPQMAGRATVFYVDAGAERTLRQANGLLVGLSAAVSEQLHWDRPAEMFGWLSMRCRQWAYGDQRHAPPSLPMLAVSVLAASKMASEGDISSSNYYQRLAEVFGVGDFARANLRSHFQPVASMWRDLDAWLESQGGKHGYSTISADSRFTRIGYSISQALLREQDRRILTAFFAATDVTPGHPEEYPGPEIVRRLRLWTSSNPNGLSAPLLNVLHGRGREADEKRAIVSNLLELLVEHWDGTLYESRQQARAASALRLLLTRRGRGLKWIAEEARGIAGATVRHDPSGESYEVANPYGGLYEGLRELEVSARQLIDGLVLEGDDLYLTWTPKPFVFFREDEYSGDFLSVGTFSPGEPHHIMVPNHALSSIRSVLQKIADGSRLAESNAPLPGWTLLKNVDLSAEVSPANLLNGNAEYAEHFIPSTRRGIRFAGGLRIGRDLGQHHYLQGGVPDWLLPRDLAQGEVTLRVTLTDGEGRPSPPHDFPLKQVLRPFPARRLPFSDGTYHLRTLDTGQATFTVSSALCEGQAPGTGSLGHHCGVYAKPEATRASSEIPAIRGAKAPERTVVPESMTFLRQVQEIVLLGAKGELLALDLPDIPDWAKRLPDEAFGYRAEVPIPEGFVWAVQRSARRTTAKSLQHGGEQIPAPEPGTEDTKWAETVLAVDTYGTGPAWHAYIDAARKVLR
ncbi:hypothetical protein [Streptomyces sp. NPDC048411]|uniref:hypothetical protein n=1 Tax=Streptomyces sp. NPDC048411 TaxID=3157206 RepID=UPI003453E1D4